MQKQNIFGKPFTFSVCVPADYNPETCLRCICEESERSRSWLDWLFGFFRQKNQVSINLDDTFKKFQPASATLVAGKCYIFKIVPLCKDTIPGKTLLSSFKEQGSLFLGVHALIFLQRYCPEILTPNLRLRH